MSVSFIMLVDIGNTSVLTALEHNGRFTLVRRISSRGQTGRKVRAFLNAYAGHEIAGAMICSVVPALNRIWKRELKRIVAGKVLSVGHKLNLGLKVKYPHPARIGADRLANAVAAAERYGAPVIVADFGTALTFDFVSADRAYEGGIILPGPVVFAQSLAGRTALLPLLPERKISGIFQARDVKLIGKSTEEAMLRGVRLGYLGLVKEVFGKISRDSRVKKAKICATGGYAALILKAAGLKIIRDPLLTLRGISRIYRLNRQGQRDTLFKPL